MRLSLFAKRMAQTMVLRCRCGSHPLARVICIFIWLTSLAVSFAAQIQWQRLSSRQGELPVPGESEQQTGNLIAEFDKDGVKDFVISFRVKDPALVWYRYNGKSWDRYVIEKDFLTVEAGGVAYDIDGDG